MQGINLKYFLESSRDIGYTINTAIGDLIDNSIDAEATEIKVYLDFFNGVSKFLIADNGIGMSKTELQDAMELSCKNPNDLNANKLGKYGLGMKLSSFAFSRCLKVTSRKQNEISSFVWDLDDIRESGFYEDKVNTNQINQYIQTNGTLLEWLNCDKLQGFDENSMSDLLAGLAFYISETFGRIIEKNTIKIYLNNIIIKSIDPFFSREDKTITFPPEKIVIGSSMNILVSPYIVANQKDNKNLSQDEQGFYIYRNDRLIEKASWLGMFKSNEVSKLARIRIDITSLNDTDLGVNINKTMINKVNPLLKQSLKTIAENARKKSLEYYRVKGKTLKRETKDEQIEYVWLVKDIKGKKEIYINEQHPLVKQFANKELRVLLRLLEDTIPLETILSFEKDFNFEISKNRESYLKMGRLLLKVKLQEGLSKKDAINYLSTFEPFSTDESLIGVLEGEI